MKIASWNVNSLRVRLPQVLQWLADRQPDIVGLQETKTVDEQFPMAELEQAGYRAWFSGQKTYNGVAVLSRLPAEGTEVTLDLPGFEDPQRRVLGITLDDWRFINVYVPNGSEVGSEKYAYKLHWLEHLTRYLEDQLARHPKLALVGDFNIAPEDRDVHDPAAWEGSVLVSPAERAAYQRLLELGLHDSFRLFEREEAVFSWWDYRAAAFRRNRGLRIDLILVSQALRASCVVADVDREPRTWERPSDHAPVVAEFS